MTEIIAMYLPQFHEIEENNKWWGEGFTEWRGVKKAKPLFEGHLQPREPLNKNYYDLSDANVLREQMKLAKKHGIGGFCFYHYWFNGKKLLEKPIEKLLLDEDVELPFCLCWANEPWTRTWDGFTNAKEILMPQEYGDLEAWIQHYKYLSQFFKHKKYIKKDDKPVIVIYNPGEIKERREMFSCWRKLAIEDGFSGLYIITASRFMPSREFPFCGDAIFDFEPIATWYRVKENTILGMQKEYNSINFIEDKKIYKTIDYAKYCEYMVNRYVFKKNHHHLGFFVGWDNSPRRGTNTKMIFENNTPEIFAKYFDIQYRRSIELENDFLFINAWNEWGEGTFLEPDELYRTGYLESIQRIVERYKSGGI